MIITRILGGLGNQLFQYAAGKTLSVQHQSKLLLDVRAFDEYKLRNFDLAAFNINLQYATEEQITPFLSRTTFGKLRDNVFPMRLRKVYKPKHFHFDKKFFAAPSTIYLQGYWQSEKFFAPIKDEIREDIVLRPEHIGNILHIGRDIADKCAIAVHIRRGDYNNSEALDMHGMLDQSYYKPAIQLIQDKYPDAIFYFFSDDINWAKQNLPVENAIYVSGNLSKTHLEDFYLMSQCKHNIIANSSFSWWAAWLNNNPGKTVITPKNWFNNGPKDLQDLIPEGWLKL